MRMSIYLDLRCVALETSKNLSAAMSLICVIIGPAIARRSDRGQR